uniref:Uncharacterized protein n=1 Tax=Oryza nivara TaxID=4536 RepID=A0A0E0J4B5_ORYNI
GSTARSGPLEIKPTNLHVGPTQRCIGKPGLSTKTWAWVCFQRGPYTTFIAGGAAVPVAGGRRRWGRGGGGGIPLQFRPSLSPYVPLLRPEGLPSQRPPSVGPRTERRRRGRAADDRRGCHRRRISQCCLECVIGEEDQTLEEPKPRICTNQRRGA